MSKQMRAVLVIALAVITGTFVYFALLTQLAGIFVEQVDLPDRNQMAPFRQRPECIADCGTNGWQKMSETCGLKVDSADELKKCLLRFSWSAVSEKTDTAEFKEGFIDIGGTRVWDSFSMKSIWVRVYRQWAADEDGNLYLLGESG